MDKALARPSADLLRMNIAYRLQEKQLEGLSRSARQMLQAADETKAAKVSQRKLTPAAGWFATGMASGTA